MRKYELPEFLEGVVSHRQYQRWLHRKAMAHLKRDRNRGMDNITNEQYKLAIHRAVMESEGRDAYTNEQLDWGLLSTYDNDESKSQKREYKKKFALLPSVDHIGNSIGRIEFKICGWRTNDAKSDLTYQEFIELCRKVIDTNNKLVQSIADKASPADARISPDEL